MFIASVGKKQTESIDGFYLENTLFSFQNEWNKSNKPNFIQMLKTPNHIYISFLKLSKTLKGWNPKFYETRDQNIKKVARTFRIFFIMSSY